MSTATPPAIVFTDFDGTVTLQDSNDYLTDNLGMGEAKRSAIGQDILDGKTNFRDGFKEEIDSVKTPFNECLSILLSNIKLDPGFKVFYNYCNSHNIKIIVVSSGMRPLISALLQQLVGAEALKHIEIMSNDVRVDNDGENWELLFKHPDSPFGHDKAQSIKEWLTNHGYDTSEVKDDVATEPKLFYCGDGVSDLSAAKETNLLFAKAGKDLITYCVREKIPYTEFNDFQDILTKVKKIIDDGEPIKSFVENPSSVN